MAATEPLDTCGDYRVANFGGLFKCIGGRKSQYDRTGPLYIRDSSGILAAFGFGHRGIEIDSNLRFRAVQVDYMRSDDCLTLKSNAAVFVCQ
jgi:hypothetical protein